ncbi:hypothetical protein FACS1894178_7900 [Bacteroidia bacterium]|nr:hypothetical protein FACS1894178_7900 [Bacteroidia bacterium]
MKTPQPCGLSPVYCERNGNFLRLQLSELVWTRNNYDGYKIEVYTEKYGIHLATIVI